MQRAENDLSAEQWAALEEAWREAEEIASIADRLFVPERVESLIRKWRDQFDAERRAV